MKSTGNDIVALNAIDVQRTISPAFFSKFIIPAEQALYQQPQIGNVPFQNFVWLLWSVKESVYKYLKRSQPGLIFSPSKIIIQNIAAPKSHTDQGLTVWENGDQPQDFYTGEVIFGTEQLYFRSKITAGFIASVVNDDPGFTGVYWEVSSIDDTGQENQSKRVRELVLDKLKSVLAVDHLHIEKSPAGYPIVLQGTKQLDIPVSLAHHDRFVAYSFIYIK